MADRYVNGAVSVPAAGENVRVQLATSDLGLISGFKRGAASVAIDAADGLATLGVVALDLDCSGALQINSSGGAISIGNDANNFGVNIGSAGQRAIQIGNAVALTAVLVDAGAGGSIGLNVDQGGIGLTTVTSGNIRVNSAGNVGIDAVDEIEINSSGGIIGIGNVADDFDINLGTAGVRTIAIGSAAATAVNIDAITFSIDSTTTSNITVAGTGKDLALAVTGAGAQKLTLDSAGTGVDSIDITSSVGGIELNSALGVAIIGAATVSTTLGVTGALTLTGNLIASDGTSVDVANITKAIGPIAVATGSTVLAVADSGTFYGCVPGGADDPIVFSLPAGGATAGIRFLIFNAAGKPIQFLASGAETIFLRTWRGGGFPPTKVQGDEYFSFLEIASTGLGSWIIVSASGKWYDADDPTAYRLFDGSVQDGTGQIYKSELGGHVFKTLAQRARGTIDFPGGVPLDGETFVVNLTTMTWKNDGTGNVDHVTIGANAGECVTNLVASLAECTESGNLTAWAGAADTVVVEWGTGGVAGNAIVFTEACTNMTMNGAGTLGATHTGVAAATLLTIGEDKAIDVPGTLGVTGGVTLASTVTMAGGMAIAGNAALRGALIPDQWNQTNRALALTTGTAGNYILLCENADVTFDFQQAQRTNPTLVIASANQSLTEWRSFAHNQVDAFDEIGSGSMVTEHQAPTELADNGSFDLPANSAGWCFILVGDSEEFAHFTWDSTEVVDLISNSANVVTTDTDTKFCIFDNTGAVRVRNRLGAAKKVMFDLHYYTP